MLTDCDDDDGVKDISGLRSCSAPLLSLHHISQHAADHDSLHQLYDQLSAARKEYLKI